MKNLLFKLERKLLNLSLKIQKPFVNSKALGGSSTDEVQAVDKLGTYIMAIVVFSVVLVVLGFAISYVNQTTTSLKTSFTDLIDLIQ